MAYLYLSMEQKFNFNQRERRSVTRIPIGLETTYQSADGKGSPRLGLTSDLSLDGMRLCQMDYVQPGQEVAVTFSLPTLGEIVLRGRIVWCRGMKDALNSYEAGLRWVEVKPAMRARLNAFYVERLQKETPTPAALVESVEPSRLWWRVVAIALVGFALLIVSNVLSMFSRTSRISAQTNPNKAPLPSDQ